MVLGLVLTGLAALLVLVMGLGMLLGLLAVLSTPSVIASLAVLVILLVTVAGSGMARARSLSNPYW